MTTPGGSEFGVQGDDTVAARISVDLPDEAIQRLQQISHATSDLQTNMQATAKASADYMEYLRQLPQLLQDAENAATRFSTAATGSFTSPVLAPGGQGRNDAVSTSSLWPATPGGPPRDVMDGMAAQLDELRRNNPRQYANLAAQQAIDIAGTRSVGARVISQGGDDRSDTLAPPAPRRRESTPGDGSRRPPNRNARDAEGRPRNRDEEPGGGGDSRGPGNRNDRGRGGGEGRPNPSRQDGEVDWMARAQQFQQQTAGFLNTVYNQTAQGGRMGMLDIAAQGIGGVRSQAAKFQQQQEARAAQAQAEADAMMQRAQDPDDPTSMADAAQAASAAASVASRAQALGSTAKLAMRGAGVAGLAVGGAMAVQSGGQWYQQHAAQGMQRGGGFAEGFGFEMGVRTMAMNPFISLEQSRKIMQSALQEGYTGKEFDTVTEYMSQNLQKMNVDVATSVRTLREQVEKGGQSLESVQTDLMTAQQLAANPRAAMTSAEFIESYQKGTEVAIEAGAVGEDAGKFGIATSQVFSEDPVLAGNAASSFQQASGSNVVRNWLREDLGLETSNLLGVIPEALERPEGGQEVVASMLRMMEERAQPAIQMFANADGDHGRIELAVDNFRATAQAAGWPMTRAEARRYMEMIISDQGIEGEVGRMAAETERAETGGEIQGAGWGDRAKNEIDTLRHFGGGLVGGIAEGLGTVGSWFGLGDGLKNWGAEHGDTQRENMAEAHAMADAVGMNPRIKALIDDESTYAGDIKVRDAQGNEMSLLDATGNREVLDALVGGEAQIAMPGGEFTQLKDLSAQQAAIDGSNQTMLVDLTEEAKDYLRLIRPEDRRNQNQRSFDSGEDGASRNDPPAGVPPG